ncbi:MAG: hypothetical protein VZR11_02425 [Succinimonas sp.]|nr:hypothetical protein [Succinimonas sp.]
MKYLTMTIAAVSVFFFLGFSGVNAYCTRGHRDVTPLCTKYITLQEGVKNSCKQCGSNAKCKAGVNLYATDAVTRDPDLADYMKKERLSAINCR